MNTVTSTHCCSHSQQGGHIHKPGTVGSADIPVYSPQFMARKWMYKVFDQDTLLLYCIIMVLFAEVKIFRFWPKTMDYNKAF